ncbi:hypothetical protein ScPMuIL_002282 [Solemya velum]
MKIKAPTYDQYVELTHFLIVRILIFNKRRIAEVDELKVSDFTSRIQGDNLDTTTEVFQCLGISEQALLKRMQLIEVRGKSTRGLRKVFLLLSEDMVEGIQHLLTTRAHAGIPPTNICIQQNY